MEKEMTKWFPQKVGGNSHFENAKRAKEVTILTEEIMLKGLAGKSTKHDGDNKEIVMVIDASKARIVNLTTGKFRIVNIWSDAQWKNYVDERVNEKLQ